MNEEDEINAWADWLHGEPPDDEPVECSRCGEPAWHESGLCDRCLDRMDPRELMALGDVA